ncbi:MAG: hypothetical protein KIS96_04590 [Bauldia sp.]|nr:hypothetical protein [Bauldia sp.]
MAWLLWPIGIGAALFALDRLALAAEARGWIYWRRRKPTGSGGDPMIVDLSSLTPRRATSSRRARTPPPKSARPTIRLRVSHLRRG